MMFQADAPPKAQGAAVTLQPTHERTLAYAPGGIGEGTLSQFVQITE